MSAYLTFEEENESYKKDSAIKLTMRRSMPAHAPERSLRRTVRPPVRARAEEINKAYGAREPELAARIRRRGGTPQPKFRRPRPDVITGAQRVRASRAARTMPRGSGRPTRRGGGSGGY